MLTGGGFPMLIGGGLGMLNGGNVDAPTQAAE